MTVESVMLSLFLHLVQQEKLIHVEVLGWRWNEKATLAGFEPAFERSRCLIVSSDHFE